MVHAGRKAFAADQMWQSHTSASFGLGGAPNSLHGHGAEHCSGVPLSATADRLIGDAAAQRFEIEALSVLEAAPLLSGPVHTLALAVVALARDRSARLEIAAVERAA